MSQKYITRNSSYSLKCQFLLHSWYFLMKLLLISVQLEHFKEFERNIDQVRCPKNANIYVKFLFQLPPLPLILLFSRAGVNTQTHLYIPRNGRIGIYDQLILEGVSFRIQFDLNNQKRDTTDSSFLQRSNIIFNTQTEI